MRVQNKPESLPLWSIVFLPERQEKKSMGKERIAFSTTGAGTTGYPLTNNEFVPRHMPYTIINQNSQRPKS